MDVTLVEESGKRDWRRGEEFTEVTLVGKGWHIRKEGRRRVLGEGGQHQGVCGQGAEDTRSSGVQEFKSPGVRSSRVQESGVQESRSEGVRSSGAQEFKSSRVQEFESSGVRSPRAQEFRSSGDQELLARTTSTESVGYKARCL